MDAPLPTSADTGASQVDGSNSPGLREAQPKPVRRHGHVEKGLFAHHIDPRGALGKGVFEWPPQHLDVVGIGWPVQPPPAERSRTLMTRRPRRLRGA